MKTKMMIVVLALATIFTLSLAGMAQAKSDEKAKSTEGCVEEAAGPITNTSGVQAVPAMIQTARVGKQAPDFEATAFYNGKFTKVKLSDYKGKWVVLCFYPGDFTFV